MLLCFLATARGTFTDVRPEISSTLASGAAGCGAAALAVFLRGRGRLGIGHETRWAVAGALMLGGPLIALVIGERPLEANALVIALALIPVVVGVAATAFGATTSQSLAGRAWPGLTAAAGLLLILPQPNLSNIPRDILLATAPILTGIGAALFCSRPGPDDSTRAMSALSGAGLLFGLAFITQSLRTHALPPFSLSAAALDGILALLTVMVLARLGATRWTAQFTLAPLIILLEGIFILRPRMDPRTITGLVLLAVASLFLLLPQTDDEDPALLD